MGNVSLRTSIGSSLFNQAQAQDQIGGFSAGTSATNLSRWGVMDPLLLPDFSSNIITDSSGHQFKQDTDSVIGAAAIAAQSSGYSYGMKVFSTYKFKMSSISDIRFWGGFVTTAFEMVVNDASNDSYGIHYSTVRGDTNFQFSSQGSTQTLVDSGVTADTNPHIVEMIHTPGISTTFILYDSLYNLEASGVILNSGTNMPNIALSGQWNSGVSSRVAATRSIHQYKGDFIFRPLS